MEEEEVPSNQMIEQLKDWVHGLEKLWQVASGKWRSKMDEEWVLVALSCCKLSGGSPADSTDREAFHGCNNG